MPAKPIPPKQRKDPSRVLKKFNLAEYTNRQRQDTGHAWFEGDGMKTHPRVFGRPEPAAGATLVGSTGGKKYPIIHWHTDRRVREGKITDRKKKP
ncbi:MAG: hypothetical protein Q7R47_04300 [Candidatus Diapherotrites archaeon]|nr:hypothetical protein [Candidatus Diapherotrites archaeon]